MIDETSTAGGWYEATRVESPERASLNFPLDVDVCVIGAGLAGLTAAREIAQRGWSVAVLEAGRVACAASGRNTGFVLPGFGEHFDDIVERIGLDHAKQLWNLSERGVDYVRFTIEDTGMPGVDPVPGWLHVSKTDNHAQLAAEVERLRWIGADIELWPTQRVREALVNSRYFGAVHFNRAFHIHPLNYALGLARRAEAAGARIFEMTPAVSIDPSGVRKRVGTEKGLVRAGHVVIAGNVHLGALMPQLSATLLPITTFVLVTEPLGPALHELVRYRGAVSDTNRADNHYRIVGENRLQWSGRMRAWAADPRWIARGLVADIKRTFPASAASRSRICGVVLSAAPCIACRRSASWSAACGWRAASAVTGSTPRRWAANWWRAASSTTTRPGACSRPTNWSGPAASSAARWHKGSIGAASRSSAPARNCRAIASRPAPGRPRGWRRVRGQRKAPAPRPTQSAAKRPNRPAGHAVLSFGHIFVEYERLVGDAAHSPLVNERGMRRQVQIGLGVTYSFDMEGLW